MLKSEIRRQRESAILSKLDKLGIATVTQIMRVDAGGLGRGGRRNALRVLNEMVADGMLKSKYIGAKIFTANLDGNFGKLEHTLIRNDFLLWKGWFEKARIEAKIIRNGKVVLIADAAIEVDSGEGKREWLFIEVDNRQKLKNNVEKMKKYREMNSKVVAVCYRSRAKHWVGCQTYIIEDWRE